LVILLVSFISAGGAFAQSNQGRQLRGIVQDNSQAAIAGARVTLQQGSTRRTVVTSSDGRFEFAGLSHESAEITFAAEGFGSLTKSIAPGTGDENLSVLLQPETVSTQIEVTGSRTPLPANESADSIQLLTQQQLETSGSLEVDDVLRQIAGFDLFRRNSSRTSNPTTQGVSLRGIGSSGASRALILLDGVPVTDPFGGWVNWSQIPREAVEEVEMVRGGASDLYGGQALSGVVQLFTKTPQTTDGSLDISYGNQSTPNISGYLGHAFGKLLGSGAGEYFRTAGYTPVEPQQRGLVDNAASSLHRTGELQLQRQLWGRSRVFVRGLAFDDSRHNGTIIEVNRTRSWQATTGFDWSGSGGESFQARGYGGAEDYHQTFASVAADRNSETLARVQEVPSRFWGLNSQYSRNLGTRNTLLAGVDFSHVTGDSQDEIFTAGTPSSLVDAGGRDRSTGVFVEDIARITGRWIVTGVFRFDDWQTISGFNQTTALPSQKTVFTSFPDRSETSFDPKLGTRYRVSESISLRASAYRSFRSPTLNELYRSFRLGNVLTQANQQLRAERLTGVEAGPTEILFHGKLDLQQGFFWAQVHRPVESVTVSTTPSLITRLRENLGSTRATGFEAQADWVVMKGADLSAQYQLVDAEVTSYPANPMLVGLQVPEVPHHEFTFQARYANPRFLTLAFQGRSTSSVFDDDQNTLPLDSYFKLDAFVSRRINSFMDVYAAGENLLNQHFMVARTPTVTLGSPFVGRVGVQLHLGR
jgi:outer membrane receptor protein involved in Fe transport